MTMLYDAIDIYENETKESNAADVFRCVRWREFDADAMGGGLGWEKGAVCAPHEAVAHSMPCAVHPVGHCGVSNVYLQA